MKLFVDGQEVVLGESWDVGMNFKFIDTYNPSAIKTPFSTTVKLPGCKQNSLIFTSLQSRYPFELFTDSGRIVEKGYCTLDSLTETDRVISYNLTLYGGLGDFFYNLQGDSDNPKTLADLDFGTGFVSFNWDEDYVYESWDEDYGGLPYIFKGIPAMVPGDALQKEKTIVPSGSYFTADSGSSWEAVDGTLGYLVESNEDTVYGKQDFRSELMPLGIRYKSIIDACCNPANNGGYTVNLDPEFFTSSNKYYTDLFLVRSLPTENLNYDPTIESSSNFSLQDMKVGNYQGTQGSTAYVTSKAYFNGTAGYWTNSLGNLILTSSKQGIYSQIQFSLVPYFNVSPSATMLAGEGDDWLVQTRNPMGITITVINLDTQARVTAYKHLPQLTSTRNYKNFKAYLDPFEGVIEIPKNWTRLEVTVTISNGLPLSSPFYIRRPGTPVTDSEIYAGDLAVYYPDKLSNMSLVTRFYGDKSLTEPITFTKTQLLGKTNSPLYYLLQFTKMFNLRFYLRPGTKTIDLLLSKNFIGVEEPLDIQDKICYDREYSITRNITDVGYLSMSLQPNSNQTTDLCEEVSGSNFLGREFKIGIDSTARRSYQDVDLKVGCEARVPNILSVRSGSGYCFYGFNQNTPYSVISVSGSGEDKGTYTKELTLNWDSTPGIYDFLELGNVKDDTIVLYKGLQNVPFNECPAWITRTSQDMIEFAEGPCFLGGQPKRVNEGQPGHFFGCRYIATYKIPRYGLVGQLNSYENGLTFSNVNYSSIIATSNIFDTYFREFLEGVYKEPLQVECYARLAKPELRRLYWFDNCYWILSEVSGYNYSDSPCKCKFVRYLG